MRKRYKGWVVMVCDLREPADRIVAKTPTLEAGKRQADQLNAAVVPPGSPAVASKGQPLYWVEWWSSSSSLEKNEPRETLPMPALVYTDSAGHRYEAASPCLFRDLVVGDVFALDNGQDVAYELTPELVANRRVRVLGRATVIKLKSVPQEQP